MRERSGFGLCGDSARGVVGHCRHASKRVHCCAISREALPTGPANKQGVAGGLRLLMVRLLVETLRQVVDYPHPPPTHRQTWRIGLCGGLIPTKLGQCAVDPRTAEDTGVETALDRTVLMCHTMSLCHPHHCSSTNVWLLYCCSQRSARVWRSQQGLFVTCPTLRLLSGAP